MDQQRLFRLAPEAVAITAIYEPSVGWVLNLRVRRGDESWEEGVRETYVALGTAELLDVLEASLAPALGL